MKNTIAYISTIIKRNQIEPIRISVSLITWRPDKTEGHRNVMVNRQGPAQMLLLRPGFPIDSGGPAGAATTPSGYI
jgi:hypothetical protein